MNLKTWLFPALKGGLMLCGILYLGTLVLAGIGIATVAIAGSDSSIGRASVSPTNLVLIDSTLRYDGTTAGTDRGATLNGITDSIDVVTSTENLTIGGPVAGSAGLGEHGVPGPARPGARLPRPGRHGGAGQHLGRRPGLQRL